MALYVVRQQDGGYAVFNDLILGFCGFGNSFAECTAMIMAGRCCDAEEAMSIMLRCRTGGAVSVKRASGEDDVMTLDALLWAVLLVRGEVAMLMEAARIGLASHRPGNLESRCRDELVDLCEAYGVDLPPLLTEKINQPDGAAEQGSKAMQRAWERWSRPSGDGAAEDQSKRHPTHQSG